MKSQHPKSMKPVLIWLLVMAGLIALMVTVGGATRLTDSGLSITEWKPVTGAIPPLSEAHWLEEFEKYKQIPEYEQVNWGMSLEEFKVIYWWEWGHRFLGRLIGVVFLLPFLFFAATGRIDKPLGVKLGALFVLGGLQGALGWWMVSSGLTERIDVSQYRLAAHLGLAIILFGAILWVTFDLMSAPRAAPLAMWPAALLAGGVYLQMILGAFVAGLRAGRTFNTWPLMDGKFFPDGYFTSNPAFHDLFETMAAVQFNHRMGAYLLTAAAIWFFVAYRKSVIKGRAHLLLGLIGVQVLLGIWTVVAGTPLWLGLAHQLTAVAVFGAGLYAAHGTRREIIATGPKSQPSTIAL